MGKKTVIILIVGTSGSGKTHMSHYMKKYFNIPYVVSFTTRPIRAGETEGVDHYFIDGMHVPPQEGMLAYTNFGGYQYFTLRGQVEKHLVTSYVVDEDGVRFFLDRYKEQYTIVAVYVHASAETRKSRGISQERIDRDTNREPLPLQVYSCMINNNDELGVFNNTINHFYFDLRDNGTI